MCRHPLITVVKLTETNLRTAEIHLLSTEALSSGNTITVLRMTGMIYLFLSKWFLIPLLDNVWLTLVGHPITIQNTVKIIFLPLCFASPHFSASSKIFSPYISGLLLGRHAVSIRSPACQCIYLLCSAISDIHFSHRAAVLSFSTAFYKNAVLPDLSQRSLQPAVLVRG